MKTDSTIQHSKIKESYNDWKMAKLGDILTLEYGKALPERERKIGIFPVFGSNGIVGYHEQFLIEGPGIVVGRKGTIGAVTWINSNFWAIDTSYYIKTKNDNVFLKWLFYKLNHSNLSKLSQSDVVPGLNRELVYHITIPLPPLPEQRRIAEVLGTVDSAIQKVGGAIESTERLKKGLMQRLLTRGIGHERFKFSKEFGCEFPEEWKVINLGRATEIIMGQSPPGDTYNTSMNGIHLINGPAEFGEKYPIPNKWTSEPTKITKKNDVLICVRGHTTGRLNISDKEFCIGRGVAAIRNLPDATNNIFLYYILDWMRNKIFGISYAAGSIFPNINRDQLNKLDIPLPPLPEQRRIADILSAVDRKLELERRRREKLERVKKGLMNELLTGRKRIKVENDGNIY